MKIKREKLNALESYSAIKRNKLLIHTITCKNLKETILNGGGKAIAKNYILYNFT